MQRSNFSLQFNFLVFKSIEFSLLYDSKSSPIPFRATKICLISSCIQYFHSSLIISMQPSSYNQKVPMRNGWVPLLSLAWFWCSLMRWMILGLWSEYSEVPCITLASPNRFFHALFQHTLSKRYHTGPSPLLPFIHVKASPLYPKSFNCASCKAFRNFHIWL